MMNIFQTKPYLLLLQSPKYLLKSTYEYSQKLQGESMISVNYIYLM